MEIDALGWFPSNRHNTQLRHCRRQKTYRVWIVWSVGINLQLIMGHNCAIRMDLFLGRWLEDILLPPSLMAPTPPPSCRHEIDNQCKLLPSEWASKYYNFHSKSEREQRPQRCSKRSKSGTAPEKNDATTARRRQSNQHHTKQGQTQLNQSQAWHRWMMNQVILSTWATGEKPCLHYDGFAQLIDGDGIAVAKSTSLEKRRSWSASSVGDKEKSCRANGMDRCWHISYSNGWLFLIPPWLFI